VPKLAIGLDQVAVLRQSRRARDPDPVAAAYIAEMAGADAIVIHLRSDRRHAQERDVEVLRRTVTTPLHLMTAATAEALRVVAAMEPDTVTLVPERHEEVTTEGGLDGLLTGAHMHRIVGSLQESGYRVTLLVDPELDQIRAAAKLSADGVQINARHYADAEGEIACERELARLQEATRGARRLKLKVCTGRSASATPSSPVPAL
jgi:pyridoxine 5-phosphate synthase